MLFTVKFSACFTLFLSDGYSTKDINYIWFYKKDRTDSPVKIAEGVQLPQFSITGVSYVDKMQFLTTGNYSRLACKFNFQRNIGFYLIQIYLPSQLIVIISWVSFWLSRDATPARVALGITTVLTMTTLMTTTNSALPKVSYIKSIDIYLITCYSMVFAALLEYAAVCYLSKIMKRRKEKQIQTNRSAPAAQETSFNMNSSTRRRHLAGSTGIPGSTADPTGPLMSHHIHQPGHPVGFEQLSDESPKICTCDWERAGDAGLRKLTSLPKKKPKSTKDLAVTPSAVDKYSRLVFPVVFIVFNGLYWGIYLKISAIQSESQHDETT